ncbi:hypothetical protein [Methylomagnum sp.]
MTVQSTRPYRLGALSLLVLLSGCAGVEPKGVRPDPASIKKVLFRFEPDTLESVPAARQQEMAERVSKNLGAWGYGVTADGKGGDYSHVMEAKIGAVSFKSTPQGFSFTVGNSDPRALDFQKADVLPVDCVLYPVGRAKDRASLYMDFMADDKVKGGVRNKPDPAVEGVYVNHAATVCFNLLEDLKVQRGKPAPIVAGALGGTDGSSGDTWFPEVRIEVREKPAASSAQPAAVAAPAVVPGTVPVAAEPSLKAAPASAAPSEQATPVSTETRSKEEGRKQMVIHNQGSPIILEFGYERK